MAFITPSSGTSILFQSDFESYAAGATIPGQNFSSGTYVVGTVRPVSGTKSFGSTHAADGDAWVFNTLQANADLEMSSKQKVDVLVSQNMSSYGHLSRMDSTYQNGYLFLLGHLNSGGDVGSADGRLTLAFFKRVSGAFQLIEGNIVINTNLGSNATMCVKTQSVGNSHNLKVWNDADTEPTTWIYSKNDGTFTAAGYTGFYNGLGGNPTGTMSSLDDLTISKFAAGGGSTPNITADNAGIAYSPFNVGVIGTSKKTINSGAYIKTFFTGTACKLAFDLSNNPTPLPQIWAKVDNGPDTTYEIAANVTLQIPSDNTWGKHRLEIVVKSTSETLNRWNDPQNTGVVFQGLVLDTAATVSAPALKKFKVLVIGDSIVEGVRTLSANTGVADTFRNDVKETWAWKVFSRLGVEFGIVGFGGSGFTTTGSGNVPVVTTTYNKLWNGVSRTDLATANLIVTALGTNDQAADATAAETQHINNLLAAAPSARLVIMRPFTGAQASNLQAAIAACNDPLRVEYRDTAGQFDTAQSSDNVHPYGIAHDAIAGANFEYFRAKCASAYPGGFLGV